MSAPVEKDPLPVDPARQGIAFALTGLGGSNAFGTGFLQAALDCDVTPKIITCTSGMIVWTKRYLEALAAKKAGQPWKNLEAQLQEEIDLVSPWPPSLDLMNKWNLALSGIPRIFKPAIAEYWLRPFKTSAYGWYSDLIGTAQDLISPSQLVVPLRTPADYQEIANVLNDENQQKHGIAVCFNSFNAAQGIEYLSCNAAAEQLFANEKTRRNNANIGTPPGTPPKTIPQLLPRKERKPIDEFGVKDALWLTLYGEPERDHRKKQDYGIDGAYLRSVILSDLTMVDKIFIPRPVDFNRSELPSNYFEAEDFKIELWWNSSYAPQVDKIEFINQLVNHRHLTGPNFQLIDLIHVPIHVDRGYFQYFIEDMATFQRGVEEGKTFFRSSIPGKANCC